MHESLLTCFLSAAIPLLGAAGTSESMAWLAGEMERLGWTMDAQDALDHARELFLAGEQWRWLRGAAPAAFKPDEQDVPTGMDAHAAHTEFSGSYLPETRMLLNTAVAPWVDSTEKNRQEK